MNIKNLLSTLTIFLANSLAYLFPHVCVFCRDLSSEKIDLCADCKQGLPWLDDKEVCMKCALPLPSSDMKCCGQCLQKPPSFDRCISLFYYQEPISQLITGLKFQHKLLYARVLGELLADKIQQFYYAKAKPEYIIPVPLYRKRLCQRGFNQALELARPIIKKMGIPYYSAVYRVRNTAAQSSLRGAERIKNVRNAFVLEKNFLAKHVAIIDDVMTTCNTLEELSRVLKAAQVERIDIWCAARTCLD